MLRWGTTLDRPTTSEGVDNASLDGRHDEGMTLARSSSLAILQPRIFNRIADLWFQKPGGRASLLFGIEDTHLSRHCSTLLLSSARG